MTLRLKPKTFIQKKKKSNNKPMKSKTEKKKNAEMSMAALTCIEIQFYRIASSAFLIENSERKSVQTMQIVAIKNNDVCT